MDQFWAAYAAAVTLGAAHALEVDHMVAVSAFVGGRPRLGAAAAFGLRWGLGHGVAVLVVGSALALSGLTVPPRLEAWAEAFVGVALVGVGAWALAAARRLHVHTPAAHEGHAHLHAHPPDAHPHHHSRDPRRRHRHLVTLVGAAHGLAGSAPVAALIPVTLMPRPGAAVAYLALFGAGTALAMAAYAVMTAIAVRRLAASLAVARGAAFATAGASGLVGVVWILKALGRLAG